MDIKQFFDLPEEQRQLIIDLHNKQKKIRYTREQIVDEFNKLKTREANNQISCDHPFAVKEYKAHENEFGNLTGGGQYYCHCDDCGFRWVEDK